MKQEVDGDTNCNWYVQNDLQRVDKEAGRVEHWRTSQDNPNYSIIKIAPNTEKSPGELRRVSLNHTSVKDHLLKQA